MSSFALDNTTWDLFVSDGSLAVVDGCEEIKQCIKQDILALDLSTLLGTTDNFSGLSAIIKSIIVGQDKVLSLSSFSVNNDIFNCGVVRGLTISFTAQTTCGTITAGI